MPGDEAGSVSGLGAAAYSHRFAEEEHELRRLRRAFEAQQRTSRELALVSWPLEAAPIERGRRSRIVLHERRHKSTVERALSSADGHFGVVLGAMRSGARGRLVRLVFDTIRPDGGYDVVVQGCDAFVVRSLRDERAERAADARFPAIVGEVQFDSSLEEMERPLEPPPYPRGQYPPGRYPHDRHPAEYAAIGADGGGASGRRLCPMLGDTLVRCLPQPEPDHPLRGVQVRDNYHIGGVW